MATSFFGLVRLMISGGDNEEEEQTPAMRCSNQVDEKKISRWEFIDEEPLEIGYSAIPANTEPTTTETPSASFGTNTTASADTERTDREAESKKKVNRKKKSKRKRRANSVNSMEESKKGVKWGSVEVVNFTRDLGFHTVPYSGNFPLGLGEEVGRYVSTIDQHFAATQIRLLERATEIGLDISTIVDPHADPEAEDTPSEVDEDAVTPRISLETRQFDYRHGYNPLFRPLSEADRIVVLGSLSRQATVDGAPLSSLNKELVDIRKSREDVGCNCKQMKLDKLNVAKLRQELISHQNNLQESQPDASSAASPSDSSTRADTFHEILTQKQIDSLSKSELVNRLRGVYKSCPLCVLNDCACVAAGVGCHSNVCCCFRAGGVKNSCENPTGARVYMADAVKEHRKTLVTATALRSNSQASGTPAGGTAATNTTPPVRSRAYSA